MDSALRTLYICRYTVYMYLLMIIFSAALLFFMLYLGGSILDARGLIPAELAPFNDLLASGYNHIIDFVTYLLAYFF